MLEIGLSLCAASPVEGNGEGNESSALLAQYDFSNLSSLYSDTAMTTALSATGEAVAAVADQYGNIGPLMQGDAGNRPLSGSDGIIFDGVDDYLTCSDVEMAGKHLILACKISSGASQFSPCFFSNSETGNYLYISFNSTFSAWRFRSDLFGTLDYVSETISGDWLLIEMEISDTCVLRKNGSVYSEIASISSWKFNQIGDNVSQSSFYDGEIGEILIYEAGAPAISAVRTELAAKYGITLS